ncbi:hypothetical protein [Nocardia sp. XZ_19_385]|uniref:hypothetical protein n=1 Tax=Nocardia sp. XZ_19_385 TaxID=2769488 RepID=UPI00189035A9|nr:hypothetical protein [Nocardia sp. XZ_19_385]
MRFLHGVPVLVAAALLSTAATCDPYSGGPTEQEILEKSGLTVDKAEFAMFGNLLAVSPDPGRSYSVESSRTGCRTNASAMTEGPPWKLRAQDEFPNPTPELVRAAQDKLAALVKRDGYRMKDDQARTKSFTSTAGYEGGVRLSNTNVLTVWATTPCAADIPSADGSLAATLAHIPALTRKAVQAFNNGNPLDLYTITCGPLNRKLTVGPQTPERQAFEQQMKANASARGLGQVTEIANYRWADSSESEIAADVTVRYAKHAPGLDHTNSKRYRAVYQQISGEADLCSFEPA